MRLRISGIAVVLVGVLLPAPASAVAPRSLLSELVHNGCLRFSIVAGRVALVEVSDSRISLSPSDGKIAEDLNLEVNRGQVEMSYVRTTADEEFSLSIASGDRLGIRRAGRGDSSQAAVHFQQAPGEPVVLALGPEDRQQVFRAESIWHLAIIQPEVCRQHLAPLVEPLRPKWSLSEAAAAVEGELLRRAAAGTPPDRRHWAAMVRQLADDRFGRRQSADRQLRAAGPAVLNYLQGLDLGRLETEQQFRIQQIMTALSAQIEGDNNADQIAVWLSGDPSVWFGLLSRPDRPTRRLAARQLSALLGEAISVDPEADPSTQTLPCQQLRRLIDAEGSRAAGSGAKD
jgi:hypothetical protein